MTEELKLSERAMLVSLAIGSWSGTITDKEVTEEVIHNSQAEKGAGKWTKVLITRKYLQHPGSKISAARTTHRVLTLPWEDGGTRILAASAYFNYTEQMRLARLSIEAAVAEAFDVERLIEYKAEARQRLGRQYREEDFPTADEIRAKFYVDVEVKPIPEAGDFRTKLADKTMKSIMKDIERRTEERLEKAIKDVYQRIADVTEKMVDKLRAYEPSAGAEESNNRFRDSLVWNVKELADLLPALNITNDPKIEDMRQRLLSDLTANSPDILRIDAHERQRTAKAAEKILAKARQYLA